jgi:hypothetical protein
MLTAATIVLKSYMVTIILLQLFWCSIGLIGLAEYILLRRWNCTKESSFLQFVRMTHPVLQAVLLFVIGLMSLFPVVVVSYILQLPLIVLTVYYLLLLACAVGVIIVLREAVLRRTHTHLPSVSRRTLVLGSIAGASLLFDYLVSLRVGAPLYGDAPVQLAKITFFKDVHFALTDPYYSNHGIVDPRYSTNVLDACQALAASLLHATAAKVWMYSYGFYRLLIWLSLFGLLWTYLGKQYRHLAYVMIAVMLFVWGGYFIFADLPDRIVLAWAMLFFVGLKVWLETDSWPLIVIAALLTASTHALFSLILLGYVAFLTVVLWISRTRPLRRMIPLFVCAGILILPVAVNLYYPNHTNQDTAAFISGAIAGTAPTPRSYGPLILSSLPSIPIFTLAIYVLFVAYVWLIQRTGRRKLMLFAYLTGCFVAVFMFNANVFALIGYGAIIYLVKQRSVRIAVAALVIYYGLIVYNPIFWHVELHKLPLWMVARFQELNVFGMVAATTGLIFAVTYPLECWGYRRFRYVMIAVVACLSVVYLPRPTTNDYNIQAIWDTKNILFQTQRNQSLAAITTLSPYLHDQLVYSNDPNIGVRIPGVVVTNVYSFNPENESPMTNIALREECSARLAQSMQLATLRAAGITRVITDPPYSLQLTAMAKIRPYLVLIAQADNYQVYAVKPGDTTHTVANSCTVPFGQ